MQQQGDLPIGMGYGVLLEGLLAGYRYLGRYLWRSPRSPRHRRGSGRVRPT